MKDRKNLIDEMFTQTQAFLQHLHRNEVDMDRAFDILELTKKTRENFKIHDKINFSAGAPGPKLDQSSAAAAFVIKELNKKTSFISAILLIFRRKSRVASAGFVP
ncbi:hypothetical protein Plhal304r1_c033g0105861 [Plasmopara halstedii]